MESRRVPINSAEGFIRQIIGWREYMRGIYFREGPGYTRAQRAGPRARLPPLYWGGETRMNCLSHAVAQTREEAYAHHIQRLMVTGNFALLAGVDPAQVHEWYLAVYVDAFEWVEAPNTIGMSQFADGGIIASKPYVSRATTSTGCRITARLRLFGEEKDGRGGVPLQPALLAFPRARHRDRFAATRAWPGCTAHGTG